jgi:hypothetical protein
MKPRFHIFLWSLEGESSHEYYSDKLPSPELTAKYPIQTISLMSYEDDKPPVAKTDLSGGPRVSAGSTSDYPVQPPDAGQNDPNASSD